MSEIKAIKQELEEISKALKRLKLKMEKAEEKAEEPKKKEKAKEVEKEAEKPKKKAQSKKLFNVNEAAILRARLYMGESAEDLAHEEDVSVEVIEKLLVKKGDKPLDIIFRAGHDFDERVSLWEYDALQKFKPNKDTIASSVGFINGIFYIWMDVGVEDPIEHRFTWSVWRNYEGSKCNLDVGLYTFGKNLYDRCVMIKFNTKEKFAVLREYREHWYKHLENKKKK